MAPTHKIHDVLLYRMYKYADSRSHVVAHIDDCINDFKVIPVQRCKILSSSIPSYRKYKYGARQTGSSFASGCATRNITAEYMLIVEVGLSNGVNV